MSSKFCHFGIKVAYLDEKEGFKKNKVSAKGGLFLLYEYHNLVYEIRTDLRKSGCNSEL